jgi:hypothetical protein
MCAFFKLTPVNEEDRGMADRLAGDSPVVEGEDV